GGIQILAAGTGLADRAEGRAKRVVLRRKAVAEGRGGTDAIRRRRRRIAAGTERERSRGRRRTEPRAWLASPSCALEITGTGRRAVAVARLRRNAREVRAVMTLALAGRKRTR